MPSPIIDAAREPGVVFDLSAVASIGVTDEQQQLAKFRAVIDLVHAILDQHGGERLQLRHDGMMARFELDLAHQAVNAAIAVQEQQKLAATTRQPRLGIGLAAGPVQRLAPEQTPVGATVERARRLAVTANDGAILVDVDTVSSARLHQIHSAVGLADGRRGRAYLSAQGWLPATDTQPQPILYHEVLWDTTTRGLRPDALPPTGRYEEKPPPDHSTGWKLGRLRNWNRDRQHGFIVAEDGEFFYVDDRFLACTEVPPLGAEVWFRPRPALIEGKNRVAAMVVTVGGTTGASVLEDEARIRDQAGNTGTLAYIGAAKDQRGELDLVICTDQGRPVAT